MTYEDIVAKARQTIENADAREIHEHIAVQINVFGEGEGAFYIEVAERQICVEPYEYYNRDGIFWGSGETIYAIAEGTLKFSQAMQEGKLHYEGNPHKLQLLEKIKPGKRK